VEHAVIMAGGPGTRLWPLSRNNHPKFLLRLFEGRSLLRRAYERLAPRFPADRIHVITTAAHLPMVVRELPELPSENLIGEPCGRDTANAVGFAAALLERRDPCAVMGIFTADHIIKPIEKFTRAVDKAFRHVALHPESLVTFGIRPKTPHTGYGYVHRGDAVGDPGAEGVYRVRSFREKPDAATAARYLASGEYYWNSGMFVWRARPVLDELARNLPDSHASLIRIAEAWSDPAASHEVNTLYPTLRKISIDFAVMEKADHVAVVEMDCDWMDVGSWTSMREVVPADASGNVAAARQLLSLDAEGNIVVAEDDHLIALIGTKDLIVVRSGDATLICTKESAERLKELVGLLQERYGVKYL